MNPDTELDTFKREIDLRQFAAGLGYKMERRESWRAGMAAVNFPGIVTGVGNANGALFGN